MAYYYCGKDLQPEWIGAAILYGINQWSERLEEDLTCMGLTKYIGGIEKRRQRGMLYFIYLGINSPARVLHYLLNLYYLLIYIEVY